METTVVEKEKVTASNNFCLGPGIQVWIGSFINYTVPTGHSIELRVLVGREDHFKQGISGTILYVQQFDSLPLSEIIGDVIVPAQKLLSYYGNRDYRDIVLQSILASEIQEVHFDLDRRKMTCELWFGCIKVRPRALIPKEQLDKRSYFCPAG
jgi:hypothetical protein